MDRQLTEPVTEISQKVESPKQFQLSVRQTDRGDGDFVGSRQFRQMTKGTPKSRFCGGFSCVLVIKGPSSYQ